MIGFFEGKWALMRHLITGANGFVGSWLARRLVEKGDSVRALVRAGSDDSALRGIEFQRAIGDVTLAQTLPAALEGIDVVFHLAGIRRGATRDDFMAVNAEGTRLICEAMVKTGTRRLVLCSSLAASGPSMGGRPKIESDPLSPEEWYGESKAEAERIAFGYADKLEVTSCRPSRIAGPGDRENLTFFKVVKKGVVLRIGGAPRLLSMVDVEDVVSLLILQGHRSEAVGEAFFAAGPDTVAFEELLRMMAVELGVSPRTLYLPELIVSAIGHGADAITRMTGRRLPFNRKLARQLLAPGWTCSIEKAQRMLGYQPRFPLVESVRRSARSYLDAGWL
jgi:dihydroflavonol-4-reductase